MNEELDNQKEKASETEEKPFRVVVEGRFWRTSTILARDITEACEKCGTDGLKEIGCEPEDDREEIKAVTVEDFCVSV